MARPYDLYVRFLVTKGYEDLEDVNAQLSELGLKSITEGELDLQHSYVQKSVPEPILKQIENKSYEGEFIKWMKVLEVDTLWRYEKKYIIPEYRYIKLVYDIHTDPLLCNTLNMLLIKGIPGEDICQDLNIKFSYMLKKEHVDAYKKFFWNVNTMTRKDWKQYLLQTGGKEKKLLFTALTENIDVLRTELGLPSKVSISESLQFLYSSAYQKAKEYLSVNTPDGNKEARSWMAQVVILADKYEKHRVGDSEDFAKTLQLEFEFVKTDFITPDEQTLLDVTSKQKEVRENTGNA